VPSRQASDYYSHSRRELLAYIPASPRTVLDVGCGCGAFGAELRKRYPECRLHGIEMNVEAAREASATYEKVHRGDAVCIVGELARAGASFDTVFLNDIVEHLTDPPALLNSVRRLLKRTGCLIASIPNVRFWPVLWDLLKHGNWRYTDAGVLDRQHLRFFTQRSIQELFTMNGYGVDRIHGINAVPLPWKLRILTSVFHKAFTDTQYPQFAVVARRIE